VGIEREVHLNGFGGARETIRVIQPKKAHNTSKIEEGRGAQYESLGHRIATLLNLYSTEFCVSQERDYD
jgi:hypothetical protein